MAADSPRSLLEWPGLNDRGEAVISSIRCKPDARRTVMAGRVENKVALITGGGSGIGRATALLFGREGASVVVADYNAEGGARTVKTIKEAGGTAVFHAADVSNPQDVDGLMHKVMESYGRLDCAFRLSGAPFLHTPHRRTDNAATSP
jgi:NAD(P)-dependent dehydrogenase (short-subunit alcohol dehydrogenase family)